MKKIQGTDEDGERKSEDDSSDEELEDATNPEAARKKYIEKNMKTLWDLKNDNSEFPKKGLFSLKFMQRGIESQRTKNEEMIEELEKQMIDGDIKLDSEDDKKQ